MAKKTVSVESLREMVNSVCLNSENKDTDIRQGMLILLEHVLHDTGNYKGFRYLPRIEMPHDSFSVGIHTLPKSATEQERFADTDSTRVHYF